MNDILNKFGMIARDRACRFLLAGQDSDGFWRDYVLQPGVSVDWVTAFVGYALLVANPALPEGPVARALSALQLSCRRSGWGYNPKVATDADTTSWVIRVFIRAKKQVPIEPISCLDAYVGPHGGARTFVSDPKYGRWTEEHVDVTALLGLAMQEAGAATAAMERLRSWILGKRNDRGLWSSFWWTFDAYATARSLEFLSQTGGLPDDVVKATRVYVEERKYFTNVMETANLMMMASMVGTCSCTLISLLLDHQFPNGAWPPSLVLKVPSQRAALEDECVFEDVNGFMSTAMSVMALTKLLETNGRYA